MADLLDNNQKKVIDSPGSTIVIAGPGSGKTRVLTSKAIGAFRDRQDILCLTFTRAAAAEMQSRQMGLPACTIHSYCCGLVGWKEQWGYDGLLQRALWEKDKKRYDLILLDECQDVNELELDVVLSLVGGHFFAVGDPYQSIYGFQGAMGPKVVDRLKSINGKVMNLTNNYRSSPQIVDRLNRFYKRDLVSKDVKDNGLTAILFRKNTDLFFVSDFLKNNEVPHTVRLAVNKVKDNEKREYFVLDDSKLRLMTIHASKGLEFSRVILFDWKPQRRNAEEERVFYVAMSRASKEFIEVDTPNDLLKVL